MSNKFKKGLLWSFIDSILVQIIAFVFGIILARLLGPEEFGVIGMVTVFIAISNIFVTSGFSDALMRKKQIKQEELSTVFWFNLSVSVFFYVLLLVATKFIAIYFETPVLHQVIPILSIGIILNAFILVQRVMLTKAMDFKSLTKVSVISTLVSGGVAIIFAYQGFGVWSLVLKTLLAQILTIVILTFYTHWRPSFVFDINAFMNMFAFGGRLLALGLVDTLYKNVYYLIIGKVYSPVVFGYYTRAESLKNLPSNTLTSVVQKVTFPLLAEIQDESENLKTKYKGILVNTMFLSMVGMFLLASIAKPLVLTLLGTKWETTGDYLEILCFVGLFYPLVALNSNILKVKKRADVILKVGILRKIMGIPVILCAVYIGIEQMLYAMILQQIAGIFLLGNYPKKLLNYGLLEQISDFIWVLIGNLFLFLLVKFITSNFQLSSIEEISFSLFCFFFWWLICGIVFNMSWVNLLKVEIKKLV